MNDPFDIKELYQLTDSFRLEEDSPKIGVSANHLNGQSCVAETYLQSIIQVGGAPVIVPVTDNLQVLSAIVKDLDGLLVTGGGDINPLYVHEEPLPALQDVDT